jgi:hypothetical protein
LPFLTPIHHFTTTREHLPAIQNPHPSSSSPQTEPITARPCLPHCLNTIIPAQNHHHHKTTALPLQFIKPPPQQCYRESSLHHHFKSSTKFIITLSSAIHFMHHRAYLQCNSQLTQSTALCHDQFKPNPCILSSSSAFKTTTSEIGFPSFTKRTGGPLLCAFRPPPRSRRRTLLAAAPATKQNRTEKKKKKVEEGRR